MNFRRSLAPASLLSIFSVVLSACAPAAAPAPAPAQPAAGAVATTAPAPVDLKLRVGISQPAANLDPHFAIGINYRRWGLFEALVGQDDNGKVIPELATEWKNLSPTTWQFKLVQGRKFHDGTPVTADDVKFSIDRAVDPTLKLGITARVGSMQGATIADPQNVVITTKDPDPLLLKRVATIAIFPKAYFEKLGASDFGVKPMGSGPYMLKEFVPNDHAILVANPNYPTKPFASELTMRFVPEASARIAGLKSGELDIINTVPIDQADSLKSGGFNLINFNLGQSFGAWIISNQPEMPTSNKLVRQALNYAIDKETLAKTVFGGLTKPEQGQNIQASTVGFNPNLKAYPYDPKKAKDLLAQAGYPNGIKIKIDLATFLPAAEQIWLYVQSQYKDAGIELEINKLGDTASWLDRYYGRVARGNLISQRQTNSPAMDADFIFTWYRGNSPDPQKFYSNPAFDEPYLASLSEMDEAKRAALLQRAAAALNEDPGYVFLVEGFELWATSGNLTGAIARADQEPKFEQIKKK